MEETNLLRRCTACEPWKNRSHVRIRERACKHTDMTRSLLTRPQHLGATKLARAQGVGNPTVRSCMHMMEGFLQRCA